MNLASQPRDSQSTWLNSAPDTCVLDDISPRGLLRLRQQLEKGLPISPRPYQELAEKSGLTEQQVMDAVQVWQDTGMIKRIGLVVRHRTLGYTANAMVVWDVPDEQVPELGRTLAAAPFVTLCYRRPRRAPDWPYNLFCMIHGTGREKVLQQLDSLITGHGLEAIPRAVLFSARAYLQRGGRYVSHD